MGRKQDPARLLAFNLYCKNRNLGTIAAKLGKSKHLLYKWKRQDKWDERTAEIKDDAIEIPEDDGSSGGVKEAISIVERIVLDRLKNSTIVPRHWQDVLRTLEFLMNEKRLAEGRPTNINQTVVQIANKIMVMNETEIKDELKMIKELKVLV